MARFRFIDEDEPIPEIKEDEAVEAELELTSDEVSKIRELLANADKLLALISETTDEEPVEEQPTETVEAIEEPLEDEDVEAEEITDEDEEVKEEVINTEEVKDSAASFGSIEKKSRANDSVEDPIAEAWNKRYNGR